MGKRKVFTRPRSKSEARAQAILMMLVVVIVVVGFVSMKVTDCITRTEPSTERGVH